jgi:hypothetical protein
VGRTDGADHDGVGPPEILRLMPEEASEITLTTRMALCMTKSELN